MNNYPIIDIPISRLVYKILHPQFENEPVDDYMRWVKYMEDNLHIMEFANDRRDADMMGVYRSLLKSKTLKKPLVVKKETPANFLPYMYYVVVGNQRLCSLRALKYSGLVPCVLSGPNDGWEDDQPAPKVNLRHPFHLLLPPRKIDSIPPVTRDFVI